MTGPKPEILAALRECEGLTRQEAADRTGYSWPTIRKYERLFGLAFATPTARVAEVAGTYQKRFLVDILKDAAAEGLTRQEAAAKAQVTVATVHTYAKRHGLQFRKRCMVRAPTARDRTMASMYRAGYTLETIGQQYSITRERVRQLLTKHYGLNGRNAGYSLIAARNREQARAARDAKSLEKWGCPFDQWKLLSAGSRSPSRAFATQRKNAAFRGIGWELTLWQWWTIWQASGHWAERGRGQGYVMCRHGDAGPYEIGNVFIALATENSSHRKGKKSGLPIGVTRVKKSTCTVFRAARGLGGKKHYLGYFKTPEMAHAAYLAAPETIEVEAA